MRPRSWWFSKWHLILVIETKYVWHIASDRQYLFYYFTYSMITCVSTNVPDLNQWILHQENKSPQWLRFCHTQWCFWNGLLCVAQCIHRVKSLLLPTTHQRHRYECVRHILYLWKEWKAWCSVLISKSTGTHCAVKYTWAIICRRHWERKQFRDF